jgi:hypothetical protein
LPADARCGAAEPKFYREKEKVCEKAPWYPEFHREKGKFVKGLCDSQRLRESLNPTVKGIPTERLETKSCGLNPTVKEILTERPETTTSCGLNPTVKGFPPKGPKQQWVVA